MTLPQCQTTKRLPRDGDVFVITCWAAMTTSSCTNGFGHLNTTITQYKASAFRFTEPYNNKPIIRYCRKLLYNVTHDLGLTAAHYCDVL